MTAPHCELKMPRPEALALRVEKRLYAEIKDAEWAIRATSPDSPRYVESVRKLRACREAWVAMVTT